MLTRDQIYMFLFGWIKAESGMTVIKANQKGPRPPRPYVSVLFINANSRIGSVMDQQRSTDTGTVLTEGARKAVASINIFGETANETLSKVRDSLDRPDVIASFAQMGIAHLSEDGPNDLTELEETAFEERSQMDLMISFVASSEVDVSTIENVSFTPTINGEQQPPINVGNS